MFSGRNIVIFSPQRWNHLYISKHHYALELARDNNVWFISQPDERMGLSHVVSDGDLPRLKLVDYKIILPEVFKFKMPALYKKVTEERLKALVKKLVPHVDWCIDFGCYQFFNDLNFIDADTKIYFPVDDFGDLKPSRRGAHKILSVSGNIIDKFTDAGIDCSFINHGLSSTFAEEATKRLSSITSAQANGKVRFGYSGNLFIRFLDIPVLQSVVEGNPGIEFHFFGNTKFDPANKLHADWWKFLESAPNVKVHGFLSPEKLAAASAQMDGWLLCYKPDYKDYHAENSHKVFEYLSTGKVMVSTHLSIYEQSELIAMSPKDANHLMPDLFKKVVAHINEYNSEELQLKRIAMALDNTYEKQVERIEKLCGSLRVAPANKIMQPI